MPLYSEHIANMYYGGTQTGTPYSYSGSVSSLGTSYSAPYLNPGGSYSSHSSLGTYSRVPLTSRWITSSGRNYSPMLSTISERVTSSPVRISSPRRIPIMKRTYGTSKYTPRPININTADIDVSKNKYQSKRKSPSPESPKISPHKISSNSDKDSSPFMPRVDGKPETGIDSSPGSQRNTIKRGRTVVRFHTIKRKERDSPRKPTEASEPNTKNDNDPDIISTIDDNTKEDSPELTKWREKLSDDLIYKGKKEEKKSIGTKLVEKFILRDRNDDKLLSKFDEDKKIMVTSSLPDPNMTKALDRRCSLELLAEQADLLDTLIRRENLSTASLDLSKVGVLDEPKTSLETYQSIKRRKSNPLKTTKSDNSLHDNLKSFKNQRDTKQFSKRRSLKKSSSGGSICRLDSITELPKELTLSDLPAIEEKRLSVKIDNPKVKPKLKAKITSSVEISAATSPLKFRVENVTVEEKPRIPKKEIIYSSSVEDFHSTVDEPKAQFESKYDMNNKNGVSNKVPPSPEPEDGNFWDKIGKRETVYLLKRKQNIEECKDRDRRALFWFPEEELDKNDENLNTSNNNTLPIRNSPEGDPKICFDDNKIPTSIDQQIVNTISDEEIDKKITQESVENDIPQTIKEINIKPEKHAKGVETKTHPTENFVENIDEISTLQQKLQSDNNHDDHDKPKESHSKLFESFLNKKEIENTLIMPENKGDIKKISTLDMADTMNDDGDKEKHDSHRNKSQMVSAAIEKTCDESTNILEITPLSSLKIKTTKESKQPEKNVPKINNSLNIINKALPTTQYNETTTLSVEEKNTTNSNSSEIHVNIGSIDNILQASNENNVHVEEISDKKEICDTIVQMNKTAIQGSDLHEKSVNSNRKTNKKSDSTNKEEAPKLIKDKSDTVEGCKCGKSNASEVMKEKSNSAEKHKVDESETPKVIKAKSKSIEKDMPDESKSLKNVKITSNSVKKQKQNETKAPKSAKEKSNSVEKSKCDEPKTLKLIKVKSDSAEKQKPDDVETSKYLNKKYISAENAKEEEVKISKFLNESTDNVTKNKLEESKVLKATKQDKMDEKNMSEVKSNVNDKEKTGKTYIEKNSLIRKTEVHNIPKASKDNHLETSLDCQTEVQSENKNINNETSKITLDVISAKAENYNTNIVNDTSSRLDLKQSIVGNKIEEISEVPINADTSATLLKQQTNISEAIRSDNIPVQEMKNSNEPLQKQSGEVNKAEQDHKIDEQQTEIKESSTKDVIKLPQTTKKPVKEEAALRPLIATPRPLQKKVPQIIHSSSSSDTSSEEDSSDDDDSDESDSSEGSTEFFECENTADGRTSTGSNDSGFDSSAPTSPASFLHIKKDCDVNCHRKCEKLTANLCGVNQRLLVEALASRTSFRKGADGPGTSTGTAPTQSDSLDLLEQELEQSTAYGLFRKTGRFTPPARSIPRFRKYVIDDFHFIKVLGKGSFGKVLLAELRDTEYYYAVKCLKKDVVLEDDDVECTLIERKVLALGTNHPYLCHLFATFQTDSHLFFVMEYLNGGDLMFHIQQSGRFPENRARLYAAEIVSGLKFLHKRGIVYRDLKLDNILLDFDGHVRIADFGMCKLQIYLEKTADTFCGTPDYMAPEIIKGLKYNQTVDWWSFGVLLYEMLIGQSPFSGCDEDELFWSICNEMPSYPRFLSQHALTILTRLLDKDAKSRLGGTECMHGDIRDQDFFNPIHWERLERRELDAPFKPRVRHPLDTQYFDRAFTGERPRLTAVEPQVLRSMDQAPFRGFSYTNPNATDR